MMTVSHWQFTSGPTVFALFVGFINLFRLTFPVIWKRLRRNLHSRDNKTLGFHRNTSSLSTEINPVIQSGKERRWQRWRERWSHLCPAHTPLSPNPFPLGYSSQCCAAFINRKWHFTTQRGENVIHPFISLLSTPLWIWFHTVYNMCSHLYVETLFYFSLQMPRPTKEVYQLSFLSVEWCAILCKSRYTSCRFLNDGDYDQTLKQVVRFLFFCSWNTVVLMIFKLNLQYILYRFWWSKAYDCMNS